MTPCYITLLFFYCSLFFLLLITTTSAETAPIIAITAAMNIDESEVATARRSEAVLLLEADETADAAEATLALEEAALLPADEPVEDVLLCFEDTPLPDDSGTEEDGAEDDGSEETEEVDEAADDEEEEEDVLSPSSGRSSHFVPL